MSTELGLSRWSLQLSPQAEYTQPELSTIHSLALGTGGSVGWKELGAHVDLKQT